MTPEEKKQAAIDFVDLLFNQSNPREAFDRYGGDVYIQHNPSVPAGREGFIEFFEQLAADHPGKSIECKRALVDGDFVVLHLRTSFPDGKDYAGIDIFRFDASGRIVEHWDVLQPIPETTANGNEMF